MAETEKMREALRKLKAVSIEPKPGQWVSGIVNGEPFMVKWPESAQFPVFERKECRDELVGWENA